MKKSNEQQHNTIDNTGDRRLGNSKSRFGLLAAAVVAAVAVVGVVVDAVGVCVFASFAPETTGGDKGAAVMGEPRGERGESGGEERGSACACDGVVRGCACVLACVCDCVGAGFGALVRGRGCGCCSEAVDTEADETEERDDSEAEDDRRLLLCSRFASKN